MSQSEWLGAVLIAGFLVWLAMNKRLAVYWSLLTGGGKKPAPAPVQPSPNPLAGGTPTVPQQPNANMPMPKIQDVPKGPPGTIYVPPGTIVPGIGGGGLGPFLKPGANNPLCIFGGIACN